MLVLPQKVVVSWNGMNRSHFEKKGYKYSKRGDKFVIDVSELPEGSNSLVNVQCDYCNCIYKYKYSKYLRAISGSTGKISCNKSECRKAHKDEIASLQRYSIDELKEFFAQYGCELLETEYNGYLKPLKFICKCGRIDEKSLDKFKNKTQSCRHCANKRRIDDTRLDYQFVKQYYKEQGCELLETEYQNNSTPMKYRCTCGKEYVKRFDNFKISPLCGECANKKRGESRRFSYEYVKRVFEENCCKLLAKEYTGYHVPMDYICVCGRPSKISFAKFLAGKRCRQCYLDRNKGENNPAWNPKKTEEERIYGRILEGYKDWKKKCRERDNFTCQCCKKRGGTLHVHHIFSYAEYPELRVVLENGITLCHGCHKGNDGFHDVYGNKETTPEQLVEFLEKREAFDAVSRVMNFIESL